MEEFDVKELQRQREALEHELFELVKLNVDHEKINDLRRRIDELNAKLE